MGRFGVPFARPFSGAPSDYEFEIAALTEAFDPAWTSDASSQNACEIRALALGIAMCWAIGRRASGIMVPARLLETLGSLETACGLRPSPTDSVQTRRNAVASKLIGFAGSTLSNIWQVCTAFLGSSFVGLSAVDPTLATSYWPGGAPGPPALPWASNLATIVVQVQPVTTADAAFLDSLRRMRNELQNLCASYTTFVIGFGTTGFVCDVGICDLTFV